MKAWFLWIALIVPSAIFCRNSDPATSTGTGRIDSLNALSLQFIGHSLLDSADFYARTAYTESASLSYIHGMAEALARLANIQTFFHGRYAEAEKLYKSSLALFQKTTDHRGLADTYNSMAFVCFSQSKYDEALAYSNNCYNIYEKNKDEKGMSDILQLITQIHIKRGEFDKGFDAAQSALQLSIRTGNKADIKGCLLGLGTLCMGIEEYALALNYYRSVFQHFTVEDSMDLMRSEDLLWAKMEFAEIYSHLNRFDSALYRYNLLDTAGLPDKDIRIFLISKGEYDMLTGQYENALPLLQRGLAIHRKLNDGNEIVRAVMDLAETWTVLDNQPEALLFAREGLRLGIQTGARQRMRDAYKVLYTVYDRRGEVDSAYHYYREYIQTKESLTDDQTKGRFAANEYIGKIELLNNEKLIGQQKLKIQNQQLKSQTLIRNILIGFLLLSFLMGALVIRNSWLRRRNEKLKNENIYKELQHKSTEMEMQALRAQMNPHFIFNCLNSINRFIMRNESEEASDYLTRFSRLIRLVLNNSKKAWIPLEDELEMLKLYMDMERMRFKNAFDYALDYPEGMDISTLLIPPLLLQPFVENAIWHGLMHKKENGHLSLRFRREKDILHCVVEDNGIGRPAAAKAGSKSTQAHKSLGIRITRDRLALINGDSEDDKVSFQIEDLRDPQGQPTGTRVSLRIRFQENSNQEDHPFTNIKITSHDPGNYH